MLLVVLIGLNLLNFRDYKEFLYAVIGENFLQVIGMGYVVIYFLFPKPPETGSGAPGSEGHDAA